MYRKLFLITCLVVLSLLISSGTMAQGPTTPEGGAGSPQLDSPAPDAAYSVDASMGTAFTYQGRIKKDSNLVNGACDMTFSLWDAATGGTQQGAPQPVTSVTVSEGLFTVQLNGSGQFGSTAFNGQRRYLAILVRCPAGSGSYITLSPRQELTAAPHAIHAQHASALYAADGSPQNAVFVDNDGKVGIGTTSPGRLLEVGNADAASDGVIRFSHRDGSSYRTWDVGTGDGAAFGWVDNFGIRDVTGNATRLSIEPNGNVGIGTLDPAVRLHVLGDRIRLESGNKSLDLRADGGAVDIQSANHPLHINGSTGQPTYINPGAGNVGIGTTNPQAKLDVAGLTRTDVLQIDGGADLAEPFAIAGLPEPGQVVVIDPDHVGQLSIADQPYDRMVAGVISGAGGLRPGLIMQQQEIVQGETHPIALTGRVYVWADASFGAIQPGDLLTTSATPGHAMKVSDYQQAQGAILGKAMSSLDQGRALVLVLVSLQ